VRKRTARRKQRGQKRGSYRSHPLNTTDAIPCIARANAKIIADIALNDRAKSGLGSDPDIVALLVDRHDMAPARAAKIIPANEAIAENRACCWQSR
jgi:hypothetical protein